ncbi:MAG: glycosyltransferase, partial [Alcaligenaceae bacterium]
MQAVRDAAFSRRSCFISTPNLNFLMAARTDAGFRGSVLRSDLSLADGMPLVWVARLLGIPIRERVPGAGLFEQLLRHPGEPITVYFFGGPPGAAEVACRQVNAVGTGLRCVGFDSPGFGSLESMSGAEHIDRINRSGAMFVIVSLGAKKGQAWIELNRHRLEAPVLCHLGAVVNFAAGTVERAPGWVQAAGAEWLWRIAQEPALW